MNLYKQNKFSAPVKKPLSRIFDFMLQIFFILSSYIKKTWFVGFILGVVKIRGKHTQKLTSRKNRQKKVFFFRNKTHKTVRRGVWASYIWRVLQTAGNTNSQQHKTKVISANSVSSVSEFASKKMLRSFYIDSWKKIFKNVITVIYSTPLYHSEFKPIELVWAEVRSCVSATPCFHIDRGIKHLLPDVRENFEGGKWHVKNPSFFLFCSSEYNFVVKIWTF